MHMTENAGMTGVTFKRRSAEFCGVLNEEADEMSLIKLMG